jgi:hypothetical protein
MQWHECLVADTVELHPDCVKALIETNPTHDTASEGVMFDDHAGENPVRRRRIVLLDRCVIEAAQGVAG